MSQILDNRATELRLGAKARRCFTAAGWNEALRQAGIAAGTWWIATYLPMRYDRGYAMGVLGYRPKGGNRQRVLAGIEPPFFESGLMQRMNQGARVRAVAKKGGARFWVVIPTGHPLAPNLATAFRTVPPQESRGVAKAYRRALIQAVQQGRATAYAKQQAKLAAKARERAFRAQDRAALRAVTRAKAARARNAARLARRSSRAAA